MQASRAMVLLDQRAEPYPAMHTHDNACRLARLVDRARNIVAGASRYEDVV